MRFLPNIRYGTERYPEKIARRLRAVTTTAWFASAMAASYAIWQLLLPTPGLWKVALVNAFGAVLWAAIPLLHRFGPTLGAIVLALTVFTSHFVVIAMLGTATGMQMHYLAAIALLVLFFGTERAYLSAALAAVAGLLVVAIEILLPRNAGLVSDAMLLSSFIFGIPVVCGVLYGVVFYTVRQISRAEAAAEREHRRSESLLSNILPPRVAERLKNRAGEEIAEAYPDASVLFADMAGFTARASDTTPAELVRFLNGVFTGLDSLVERHGLEKVKTTGDAYMVVSGVPEPRPDHAEALAALALDMRDALAGLVDPKGRPVPVRVGMASGPVVAGVVGTKKFFYDVWGDTVNLAARMEQTGETGRIQVAPGMREKLAAGFVLAERGTIEVRGKGPMRTWFLEGRRGAAASGNVPV